jgi:hypothetical protein
MAQLFRADKSAQCVPYQLMNPAIAAMKSFAHDIFSYVQNVSFGFVETVLTCTTPKATGLIPIQPLLWLPFPTGISKAIAPTRPTPYHKPEKFPH